MPLSTNQLADLRHDLTTLATINYEHLADELLDHYATLTEENMAIGQSFHEASTAAFLAMGNGKGIQHIQDDYEKATKKQVKERHMAILGGFVRWPTIVMTLLVGVLLLSVFYTLPPNYIRWFVPCMVIISCFITLWVYVVYKRRRDSQHKIVIDYFGRMMRVTNLLFNGSSLLNIIFDDKSDLVGVSIQFGLGLVVFTLAVALAQLTRETFYYKPAFQR